MPQGSRRVRHRSWQSAICVAFLVWLEPAQPSPIPARDCSAQLLRLPFGAGSFDLHTDSGLRQLSATLVELIRSTRQENLSSPRPRSTVGVPTAAQRSAESAAASLWLGKKEQRGLRELARITDRALACGDSSQREPCLAQLAEVAEALQNLRHPPVPARIDLLQAPLYFWKYYHTPVGKGTTPALDLPLQAAESDSDRFDPPNSTFWTRPEDLAGQDLFLGFGRSERPHFEQMAWKYHGPKTGFGISPGFELELGRQTLKVKFGEVHSEPLAARIFAALGFQVEPTDYVPRLRIRYDRRLLQEFNRRREVRTTITTFFVPSYTIRAQKRFDPFVFVDEAVLTSGERVSGAELKRRLFYDPVRPHPEMASENYRSAVEARILYLVTVPANVHSDAWRRRSVGVWDFDHLGHADRRELRGLALLAAWLGWFDCRILNTRLEVCETEQGTLLRHAITDLGSCLGNASSLISRRCEQPNEFGWAFTQAPRAQGKGRMTIPFRIAGYRPIEDPLAFRRMTPDDARWMARWIGHLTEEQLLQALIAAGFDSAQTKLYLEKLISRRDRMIQDLGLAGEIPSLRPGGANEQFSYDARLAGPISAEASDGVVQAPVGNSVVLQGLLRARASSERPYLSRRN